MKNSKRIIASLMAASMIASCSMVSTLANVNAAATDNCKITVTNGSTEHQLDAYQIFVGDVEDGKLTGIQWSTNLEDYGDSIVAALVEKFPTTFATGMSAADVAAKLDTDATFSQDSDNMFIFSKIMAKIIEDNKIAKSATGTTAINVTGTGYYLVMDEAGAPSAHILQVVAANESITLKLDKPTIDKVIDGKNGVDETDVTENNASMGDIIDYKVTSKVPDMRGYEKYYFNIDDTMEAGLTFQYDEEDPDEAVSITIGSTTLTGEQYDVKVNGQNITIIFNDFIQWKAYKGADITVKYSALLNENATLGEDGNDNTVKLKYSNNPNISKDMLPGGDDIDKPEGDIPEGGKDPKDVTGETAEVKVSTYTAELVIKKVDNKGTTLEGAEFLITGANIKSLAQVVGTEFVEDEEGTYALVDGKYTADVPEGYEGAMYKLTAVNKIQEGESEGTYKLQAYVDASGILKVSGLGAGSYTVEEITAPDGFDKVSPETIEIKWNADAAAGKMWEYTGTNTDVAVNSVAGTITYTVVNFRNAVLPGTGGIGTVIFYVVGSMLMAGAAVLFVLKRKAESKQG